MAFRVAIGVVVLTATTVSPALAGACSIGGFSPHNETQGQVAGEPIAIQAKDFVGDVVIVELRAPGDERIIGTLPFTGTGSVVLHEGIVTIPEDYPPGEWGILLRTDFCQARATYLVLEPGITLDDPPLAPVDAEEEDPTETTIQGPATTSTTIPELTTQPVPTTGISDSEEPAPELVAAETTSGDGNDNVLWLALGAILGAVMVAVFAFGRRQRS